MRFERLISLLTVLVLLLSGIAATGVSEGSFSLPADYLYTAETDGGIEIVGYEGGFSSFAIPSVIDGKNVVSIAEGAFDDAMGLQYLRIPPTVLRIAPMAFGNEPIVKLIVSKDSFAQEYAVSKNMLYEVSFEMETDGFWEYTVKAGDLDFASLTENEWVTIWKAFRTAGGYIEADADYSQDKMAGSNYVTDNFKGGALIGFDDKGGFSVKVNGGLSGSEEELRFLMRVDENGYEMTLPENGKTTWKLSDWKGELDNGGFVLLSTLMDDECEEQLSIFINTLIAMLKEKQVLTEGDGEYLVNCGMNDFAKALGESFSEMSMNPLFLNAVKDAPMFEKMGLTDSGSHLFISQYLARLSGRLNDLGASESFSHAYISLKRDGNIVIELGEVFTLRYIVNRTYSKINGYSVQIQCEKPKFFIEYEGQYENPGELDSEISFMFENEKANEKTTGKFKGFITPSEDGQSVYQDLFMTASVDRLNNRLSVGSKGIAISATVKASFAVKPGLIMLENG